MCLTCLLNLKTNWYFTKWDGLIIKTQRCKFQRWRTQRYFNVDVTLCDVVSLYQPKNNVEVTLKYFLGTEYRAEFKILPNI